MDIEALRDYCLSKGLATECFPFDETTLVFKVGSKMFAWVDLENPEWVILKSDPDEAIDLRDPLCGYLAGLPHEQKALDTGASGGRSAGSGSERTGGLFVQTGYCENDA